MFGECCVTSVHFARPKDRLTPFEEMVLEHAAMYLMQEIRSKTLEDVRMRKVSPERLSDSIQSVLLILHRHSV